jgi:hypothetical protein
MEIPASVLQLIERFEEHGDEYRAQKYNETQLRRDFLDPFFAALGWDMTNVSGTSEQAREVIMEYSLKIEGRNKAPDYCFRAGGADKFFVEAKKPAVNLQSDARVAFQTRAYGWNRSLPFCILTDFEEFAVYDCRFKPVATDSAQTARTFYCKFSEYPQKWPEIESLFGRAAVQNGALETAAAKKSKKGAQPFDADFLQLIEGWRERLAHTIAQRNRDLNLSQSDLNYAVQMTIDRILFLRMCEDRDIEPFEQLKKISQTRGVYGELCELFRQADNRFNSGLFHFTAEKARRGTQDTFTLDLKIEDDVLQNIIYHLYPPGPYNFRVMSVEILGQVYEQFLGKVIRFDGRKAVVEDKPEVRKAGGVYYTPEYIVRYIVENTLGKLCAGKTPKDVETLKVLDPACGSGSFLIGAYQFLLDWHLEYYRAHGLEKWATRKNPVVFQTQPAPDAPPVWRLTSREKKRILLSNIYGVDIDRQAVEVTKLSLLLKMLEDESAQTLPAAQGRLLPSQERLLPDLEANIKCGNSLIGHDFYESGAEYSQQERSRINAFDWNDEFPEIMQRGGFDAVIGNPPWGSDIDDITRYITAKYPQSTQSYRDSFKLFIEKGTQLMRPAGFLSFIVPSAFMFQPRYIDVRRLLKQFQIAKVWNIGDRVFGPKVVAPSCVFIVSKNRPQPNAIVEALDTSHTNDNADRQNLSQNPVYRRLQQHLYDKTTEETFVTYFRELGSKEVKLSAILDCRDCGIKHQRVGCGMEQKGKSDLAARLYYSGAKKSPQDHHYLIGADLDGNGWAMDYAAERYFRADYKTLLRKDEIVYFNEDIFKLSQKIVWRQTSDRIRATIIGEHWFANTLQAGILLNQDYDLHYVLGLLNSKFLNFVYIETVKEAGRVFPQVKMGKVRALPFRTINFSNKTDKARHDEMVKLVEQMLEWHRQKGKARTPSDQTQIERQITATDRKIDRLVYELYELTDEEIALVENENAR